MTGDTDKYLRPQDLRELGDDSLPQEGYTAFSIGARSARYGPGAAALRFGAVLKESWSSLSPGWSRAFVTLDEAKGNQSM